MLNEEQTKTLVDAICGALPAGQVCHAMTLVPRIGFGDTEAKLITSFVLSTTTQDFARFRQIVSRGQAEYAGEYGLSAAVLRQMDERGVLAKAPVIGGLLSDWTEDAGESHKTPVELQAVGTTFDSKQAEDRANASDYLRANVADEADPAAVPLTQSLALQAIDRVADAIGMSKHELAEKLANHWAKTPGV